MTIQENRKSLSRHASVVLSRAKDYLQEKRKSITLRTRMPPLPLPLEEQRPVVRTTSDLFRHSVLLDKEKHNMLMRFVFAEYTENVMFLYQAVEEAKSMEPDVKVFYLVDAFSNYVDERSRTAVELGDVLYDKCMTLLFNMRAGRHTDADIASVTNELEKFLVKKLMATNERFLSPRDSEEESAITPNYVFGTPAAKAVPQEPAIVSPPENIMGRRSSMPDHAELPSSWKKRLSLRKIFGRKNSCK